MFARHGDRSFRINAITAESFQSLPRQFYIMSKGILIGLLLFFQPNQYVVREWRMAELNKDEGRFFFFLKGLLDTSVVSGNCR